MPEQSAEGLLQEMVETWHGKGRPSVEKVIEKIESFLSRPREAQGKEVPMKFTMVTKVGRIPEHSEVAPGLPVVFGDLYPSVQAALTRSGEEIVKMEKS